MTSNEVVGQVALRDENDGRPRIRLAKLVQGGTSPGRHVVAEPDGVDHPRAGKPFEVRWLGSFEEGPRIPARGVLIGWTVPLQKPAAQVLEGNLGFGGFPAGMLLGHEDAVLPSLKPLPDP